MKEETEELELTSGGREFHRRHDEGMKPCMLNVQRNSIRPDVLYFAEEKCVSLGNSIRPDVMYFAGETCKRTFARRCFAVAACDDACRRGPRRRLKGR